MRFLSDDFSRFQSILVDQLFNQSQLVINFGTFLTFNQNPVEFTEKAFEFDVEVQTILKLF